MSKDSQAAAWKDLLATGLLKAFSRLPLGAAQALGRVMGRLAWHFAAKTRSDTLCNLALCLPERSAAERQALARAALEHMGMSFAEAGALWLWPAERVQAIPYEVVGEELLDAVLNQGRGVLIALPHLGAWEFINPYLVRRAPFMAMYRPAKLPRLDALMRAARERLGASLVPANAGGVKALMRHLSAGGVSILLPDQEPEPSGGVFAPFFGQTALTPTLYARLVQKTGAAPIFAAVERLERARYRLHFRAAPAGIADADPLLAATALNAGIEACVRALPEQYQWSYKRFSTRPPGEPRPYALYRQGGEAALTRLRQEALARRQPKA
ncbi:MAG: lysophospholipid acyltransferase family protein [Gammaproteobacteria bacterium]|nr:lysophospholipid acyltransferase family protein [Gammaproteobacteria bacterium]